MVQEYRGKYPSLCATVEAIGPKTSCVPQTRCWNRSSEQRSKQVRVLRRQRLKFKLIKEMDARTMNYGKQTRPCAHQVYFSPSGARPQTEALNAYIDQHRDSYRVEPICKVLHVAPPAYPRSLQPGSAIRNCAAPAPNTMKC